MPGSEEESQKDWYDNSPSDLDSSQSEEIADNPHQSSITSTSVPQASSSSNTTRRNNPRSGKMESNHKAARPPPMKPLTKEETINTFETWKGNFIYTLNLDANFSPFLDSGKTWEKKSKSSSPHRGLANAQEATFLEMLLGQIANFCPVISRNSIIKNSTSIESVWQQIRAHYGFQTSGSHFLNLCDIRMESGERPEDLFQRIQSFFEDNLLTIGSGILHHGDPITEDEDMSPTIENMIVFTWLRLIHKDLPALIKVKYGTELRNKTLASIKPEISNALPSLLEELGSSHTPVLRTSASYGGPRQPQSRYGGRGYNQGNRQNQQYNPPGSYYNNSSARPKNRSPYSTQARPPQSQSRKPMICSICKNAGRPSNHLLSSCTLLTPDDKKFLSRARLISALDEEMSQLSTGDMYPEDQHHDTYQDQDPDVGNPYGDCQQQNYQHTAENPLPATRRVITRASPYLNVFHDHSPIKFTLDTGATVNMIHENTARQLGLTITPSSQIATQADGKSGLDIIGETRFQVTRDNLTLHFEGLVASKMDTEVLAGIPFIAHNNISIHPAINVVKINDNQYPYGSSPASALVHRVNSGVARCTSSSKTIWPGEFIEATCSIAPSEDAEVAIEPHCSSTFPLDPLVTTSLKGTIRLVNNSKSPVHVSKDQHVAQVFRATSSSELDRTNCLHTDEKPHHASPSTQPNIDLISINPDKNPEFTRWVHEYSALHADYEHVFSDQFPGYNGHAGKIQATVNVSNCLPPQRKGRIPLYNRDKLVDLQEEFDRLEKIGVFKRPEEVGIDIEYVNPTFLIKKPNGTYRLVTSFGEVGKHSKPAPSLMPNVESTLGQIGQWKHIIKTDLAKAYFR